MIQFTLSIWNHFLSLFINHKSFARYTCGKTLSLLFYVNEHSVRKGNTMNKSKVTNTVKDFVRKAGEHCMVLTLNKDGTSLEGAGDDIWVSVLREKPELLQSLTTALIEAADLRDFEDALVPRAVCCSWLKAVERNKGQVSAEHLPGILWLWAQHGEEVWGGRTSPWVAGAGCLVNIQRPFQELHPDPLHRDHLSAIGSTRNHPS